VRLICPAPIDNAGSIFARGIIRVTHNTAPSTRGRAVSTAKRNRALFGNGGVIDTENTATAIGGGIYVDNFYSHWINEFVSYWKITARHHGTVIALVTLNSNH